MKQIYPPAATEFAVFSIENTARRMNVPGDVVYKALSDTDGIKGFLLPSYPALHTQSKEYIVDEVMAYLKAHHSAILS